MQTTNNKNSFLFVKLHLLSGGGEGSVEPLLEGIAGLEDGRQQEVKKRPKLRELVLQRGSGQQQPVRGGVAGVDGEGQLVVMILHPVSLVNNHELPPEFCQDSLVLNDVLVGGNKGIKLTRSNLTLY